MASFFSSSVALLSLPAELVSLVFEFVRKRQLLKIKWTCRALCAKVMLFWEKHADRRFHRTLLSMDLYMPPFVWYTLKNWLIRTPYDLQVVDKLLKQTSEILTIQLDFQMDEDLLTTNEWGRLQTFLQNHQGSSFLSTRTMTDNMTACLANVSHLRCNGCSSLKMGMLHGVKRLHLSSCDEVDFSLLANCHALETLELTDIAITDLTVLRPLLSLSLKKLKLDDIQELVDLDVSILCGLDKLTIWNCRCIQDFAPIFMVREVVIYTCNLAFQRQFVDARMESFIVTSCELCSLRDLPVTVSKLVLYGCSITDLCIPRSVTSFVLVCCRDIKEDHYSGLHDRLTEFTCSRLPLDMNRLKHLQSLTVMSHLNAARWLDVIFENLVYLRIVFPELFWWFGDGTSTIKYSLKEIDLYRRHFPRLESLDIMNCHLRDSTLFEDLPAKRITLVSEISGVLKRDMYHFVRGDKNEAQQSCWVADERNVQ